MRQLSKKALECMIKVIETLLHIPMIICFTKYKYIWNFRSHHNVNSKLVILGNGPSLDLDLKKFLTKNTNNNGYDFLCLNTFALTESFNKLKPNNYLLVDPVFFKEHLGVERLTTMKEQLSTSFIKNTTWNLNLYIPQNYAKSDFVEKLKSNRNINVVPINNVPLLGGFFCFKKLLFSLGLGNPIFQNVLIAAIFIGIKKQYKIIFLLGSDHNWIKNISVLDNNDVVLNDKHADNKDNIIVLTDDKGKPKSLHIFLNQIHIMFREYHILEEFSKAKNIKILNFTSGSFIDAFEKLTR